MSLTRDPLIGAILAKRYRVVAPIGRGGAGTVYRGIQLQLEREIAIKVVRPDVPEKSKEELEARFFREASLAGRLSHPNVVTTHDYGTTEDGQQFVVMELLRGRTLKQALKSGALDPVDVTLIGAGIARGLEHAHKRGLVHRDVKASNVFLIKDDDGEERPLLLDFGLVKSMKRELDITQTPTYLGTPLYMSPEQARGEMNIDARSDIYSLGCLLYCMCCGEMPYRGETAMATALLHLSEPYPPMKKKAPDVPVDKGLEAIVRRCLHKKPDDCFQSAGDLVRALEEWREQHQGSVVPVRTPARTAMLSAVGVIGVLGLVVGVGALAIASALVVWSTQQPTPAPVEQSQALVHDEPSPAAPLSEDVDDVDDVVQAQALRSHTDGVQLPASPPSVVSSPPPTPSALPVKRLKPAVPATPPPERPPAGATSFKPVTLDDYTFESLAHIKRAVRFVNRATDEELASAGVHDKVLPDVVANRPYRSIQAFAYTKGIGSATMRAVGDHTRSGPQ